MTTGESTPFFGYYWWVNNIVEGGVEGGDQPEFDTMGFKGQNIVVLPKYNAVVTMTSIMSPDGGLRDAKCLQMLRYMMSEFILPALDHKRPRRRRRRKRRCSKSFSSPRTARACPASLSTRTIPTSRNERRGRVVSARPPFRGDALPDKMMRILVLNPNTSSDITARLAAAAKQAAAAGTIIATATAPRGVPYIATRAEAQIGGAIALEMLAERHQDYDAAIIAAFGDPGLFGARELFDIPVVGMAEASMLTACMLGGASPSSLSHGRSDPGTRNAWTCTGSPDDAPAFACLTIRSSRSATSRTRRRPCSPNSPGKRRRSWRPTW